MSSFLATLLMAGIMTGGQLVDPKPEPEPFPDLSDPKAAAFSLAVALAQADVTAARAVYAGDQELFLKYLEALSKTKANADRLQRVITDRFGKTAWTAIGSPMDAEMQVQGENNSKVAMSAAIAVAEVKQQGDEATILLSKGLELRLKKTKDGWRVTQFPGPSPWGFVTIAMTDKFLDELTKEIEQVKPKKMYELVALAQRVQSKVAGELSKAFSPEEPGKKGERK